MTDKLEFLSIRKKCFVIYEIDIEAKIEMIVNPGTDVEYRNQAKVVHTFDFDQKISVYMMEMPDSNFLREKNSVIFEINYNPQGMFHCQYYSDRYGFSLEDGLSNYFMIGLKFKPSLQNLLFIEPPGKPLNNSIKEFCYLFFYLMKDNHGLNERSLKQGKKENYANIESFRLTQNLIEVFKIMNNGNIYTNNKSIVDFFKYMDDYVEVGLRIQHSPQTIVMMTAMYGVFSYDFFTGRESNCKNAFLLLEALSKINVNFFSLFENMKEFREFFLDGYLILINMAIKDGYSEWVKCTENGHVAVLYDVNVFWNRIYDYIRKSGTSIKNKEGFVAAKKALLASYFIREKELKNPQVIFTQLIKNIAILALNKENLLETVLEFYDSKYIEFERLRTLKDEIKRKKWDIESEENFSVFINRLKEISSIETGQIKDELKSLMYENTNSIRYLFSVLKAYDFENIDTYLLKKCMNSITDVSLDDYSIIISCLGSMKDNIKIDIMDSNFFDRLKNTLKRISLPFSPGTQNNLRNILLNLEFFPQGSLDQIKEYIKNKPTFEDLQFIVNDLVVKQKYINQSKTYTDLWLNIKNHLVNVFIEIYDLIKHTNNIISNLPGEGQENDVGCEVKFERGIKAKVQNTMTNMDFKKWISDEFWKSVNQRYSQEVFHSLCHIFNVDKLESIIDDECLKASYFKIVKSQLDQISNEIANSSNVNVSYDKVNLYFTAISHINNIDEKVIFCSNEDTEKLIINVLEKLSKCNKMELAQKYVLELPSKECFWYRLIRSQGLFTDQILNSQYIQTSKIFINKIFDNILNGQASISDFILIDKQNSIQRDAMISYFIDLSKKEVASLTTLDVKKEFLERLEKNKSELLEKIDCQLVVLNRNLKIVTDLELFFSNFGSRIANNDEYIGFLNQIKKNFKTTEFRNFKIREDLEKIVSDVQIINQWNETCMFRNIFDNLYAQNCHHGFKADDETEYKLSLDKILDLCLQTQNQIKLTLNDILINSDFSKLTLSTTKKYFKGIEDSVKESMIINKMLSLEETQFNTLQSILTTFCEITNYIKFSNTMLNLDKVYNFKKNNKEVYNNFIILINDTDSTFDKIFDSSKILSDLRTKYLEKRNIENALYELSEDQELILFMIKTPEDDIRNMVDAVDEHGDSFIRVQTIRDLLIIGSFIRRLELKQLTEEKDVRLTEDEFIDRVHSVFGKNNFQGIEALMNSCNKQFTGIKHLHSELSNREEASKIKAKEISKHSRFEFNFSNKGEYELVAYYGKNNKKINFRDLCDLRDRVLLLLYNEKEQKEEVAKDVVGLNKKVSVNMDEELMKRQSEGQPLSLRDILSSFIKSVELSEKILFVMQDIYHNGYPTRFAQVVNLKEGNYTTFTSLYDQLSSLNRQWNEDLKEAYSKYYSLSLYTGNQFWEIESILLKVSKSGIEDIDNLPGFFLLKLCNPLLKAADLDKGNSSYSEVDQSILNNMLPKDRILKLGEILNNLIDISNLGEKSLGKDTKKVNLNLKGNKFIFSSISNMKIYTYLLSIHFSIENSIPSSSQIFFCSKHTTFHELISFLYRTIYSPVERLFSILKVESLSFELQNFLVEQINKLNKSKSSFKGLLSIICSDPNSFLHTQFSENSQLYIMRDFDVLDEVLIANSLKTLHLNTTIVRSDDTGAGKTTWIQSKINTEKQEYINCPILDSIDIERIVDRLFKNNKSSKNVIDKFTHITIMGIIDDYEMLDYILFSYILIGNVSFNLHVAYRDMNDPLYIEVANTFNDFLYGAISVFSLMPEEEFINASENLNNVKINKEYTDPLQMVVNYLHYYELEQLNDTDINPEVETNVKIYSKEECVTLLQKYFIKNNPEITFRQVNIFLKVLGNQLEKFSQNYYFSVENIGYIQEENLLTIRQKIMTCLLKMTEEFTTRSIKEAREQQNMTAFKLKRSFSREEHRDKEEAKIEEYDSLGHILSWSSSNHLLVMFHADGMCVTPVYREAEKVTEEIRELVESQRTNLEDYQVFSHFELLEKLLNIVGKDFQLEALAKQTKYILTADNFLKMLLIIMRARCGVPIVIMGETGCGKTSLVKFLSIEIMQEGFEVINFHAGIKEQHILEKMEEIVAMAHSAKLTDNFIWVFLDEINTCDCMGLITELIVEKKVLGKPLPDNIVFIAACNPYKVRKSKDEVGLIKQRVATRLVYRVHPLPDSLIDYVWDYGSLSDKEERLYIGNILSEISGEIKHTSIDLVCLSQQFIRKAEDKYSVSLRDVARFNILHEWFHNMLTQKNEELNDKSTQNNIQSINYFNYFGTNTYQSIKYTGKLMVSRKALILSLMMCYYNRISKNSDRVEYKNMVTKALNISVKELDEMINEEQKDMITRMELPPAIAINKALLENVFTLLVCVINKIPLFICGKPGCSKSLSVQLLVSNLRGPDSHDPYFKKLPRILAIPYQGSESSTSEGIEKIFEKARGVLNNSHDNSIVPLIVFDEIGLAEISKNNPLKILHSLLEPEKAELAFVGISNWRLDASKMNRAVYLARPDPDLEDLESTALSIFEYYIKDPRFDERLIMKALAKTYYEFKKAQKDLGFQDFHGTRDFYALIKQVTREFNQHYNNYNEMKLPILRGALCRNFGGLETSITSILELFARNMNLSSEFVNPNESMKLQKSNDVISLVKENLNDRESRFLLLFTNGESASYILDNYLKMDLKERIFIIGSEFTNDKDKEEHSFKLLSDIILYMESGNSIIMKNLDQIYGSLYDLFNQNFMIVGEKKNCRIALGSTNNPMCYVNNTFHCVVLVDLKDLDRMDPPFLNRFEKQILTFETILNTRQKLIVKELNKWIKDLTTLANNNQSNSIDVRDLIITYNDEMAPSIVLTHFSEEKPNDDILELCKKDILSVSSISLIVYSILSSMYQSARDEVLKTHRIYFEEQHHESLDLYLTDLMSKSKCENKSIVYTYSNILDEFKLENVSIDKNQEDENMNSGMEQVEDGDRPNIKITYEKGSVNNSENIYTINIAELKSEKEFDSRMKYFLNEPNFNWVFIKFDAQKEKKHIPMIKFKVDKFFQEAKKNLGDNMKLEKNALLIIYLSRKQSNQADSLVDKFSMSLEKDDQSKLESHFLSGWSQNMIDCLAGGQISNLKNLLDLTTIEIIKKNIDQKSIAEIIFDIYLKFNFNTFNPNDSSLVKLYMTESIHKIENDASIFNVIFKKCLEFLEEKELPDWKLKICCDSRIISKSMNTFGAIKLVIQDIVSDPLLKIIHYLETESALSSYFHDDISPEKAEIFKKIWVEQFDKKDLNAIYPYNVVQSLNVSCVFNLSFPFSKSDIYEIISGLKTHIDAVFMLDTASYNYLADCRKSGVERENKSDLDNMVNSKSNTEVVDSGTSFGTGSNTKSNAKFISFMVYDESNLKQKTSSESYLEMKMNFRNEMETISNKIKKHSILFQILNNYTERSLEFCYISDLISYFTVVELKKEHKWKNCLEIIVRKCIGFDIEKIEFVYVFLFKNKKIIDSIFNIFSALQHVQDVQFIENILLKDSLYDPNIHLINELHLRKQAEVNTFLNIFNVFSQVLLSQLNCLKIIFEKSKEDLYGAMLNVFMSSLINLSLEIQIQPDSLNVIVVVTEFLKFLSNIFDNNRDEIVKRCLGIVNTDYEKISITDFSLVKEILQVIDLEMEELEKKSKQHDSELSAAMLEKMKSNVISSKLAIFESVLNGECSFDNKKMIVENILKDSGLTRYSAMIFKLVYKHIDICEENIHTLINDPISSIIGQIIDDDKEMYSYNGTICSFLSDFFRKFFKNPSSKDYLSYLTNNHESFANTLATCHLSNKSTPKYNRLICFSLVKHYLNIYGLYISDSTIEIKDKDISDKMNKVLDGNDPFVEILKNFTLKTFASNLGGVASGLTHVDYEKINIKWVNNKVFETNDNVLGLEPNLISFEKLNKDYSLFFISLLNDDSKEVMDRFKNLIKEAKERSDLKFILIQFFINKVWLSYSNPKFTESHTLKFVLKLIETMKQELTDNLGTNCYKFIELLCKNFKDGKIEDISNKPNSKNKDTFTGSYYTISSSTDSNKVGMMCMGLQSFNMILSFKTSEFCINKLFYNEKNMLMPNYDHFKNLFIPGGFSDYHDENLLLMIKHIDENYSIYGTQQGLYECICGFLYTIGDCTRPYYIGTCPNCSGQIGGTGHKLLDGHKNLISADNRNEEGRKKKIMDYLKSKLRNISGYISKMADELSTHYCIRATTPVGFRFLNHFMTSVLYLLQEIGVVDEKASDSLVEIKGLKIKAKDYFIKHLNTDLIKFSDLIKSKEYYVFCHVILGEFFNMCQQDFKFDTSIEREKVEVAFQTKIIQPKLDRLAGEISDFKQFFVTDKKLTFLSIIDEDYDYSDVQNIANSEYFRCFRFNRIGCWDDLKNEFLKNKKTDLNCQFMRILAERFDELQLVGNLYPIIQFTNYMLNLCNYRFSRAEAKEKKIRDIIEGNDVAINLFNDFCKAWDKIAYKTTQWACKQLPVLERIDADLPLSFVLLDDRELGYGMYMAAAFQYLSMIQNEVLEAIVYLIKENNNYQIWGNMDTNKYPVQKISPHEIVMFQTNKNYVHELTDSFSKFYDIYNPKFGQGSSVEYNFEKIEHELAFKLLTNKKFINYEDLTKIQYKFELLSIQNKNSNLLNDIRNKVEQKMLSFDDTKEIKKALDRLEKQNVAYLHQMFSSLEIVLCSLRYGDATQTENCQIRLYINRLPSADKISVYLKNTEPFSNVMLSNILSFYSVVEEQLFKFIIDFISPDYCRPLDDDVTREIVKWWGDYYEFAKDRYPHPEQLIKVIQRFIIRCLVASLEPKFPIKEYLNRIDFWDVDMNEEIIDNFYFEFPDTVLIANTMSFLDLMKEYHKSRSDDGRSLDFTQDKYKFDAIREEMFKKQNKFN